MALLELTLLKTTENKQTEDLPKDPDKFHQVVRELLVLLIIVFLIGTVLYAANRVKHNHTDTPSADLIISLISPVWFWLLKFMRVLSTKSIFAPQV